MSPAPERGSGTARLLVAVPLVLLAIGGLEASAPDDPHGIPEELALASGVRDPLFAMLVSLVEEGRYGDLPRERLERELRRVGGETRLPIEHLVRIERRPFPGERESLLAITGKGRIDVPIPYRILIYRPGRFRASPDVWLDEWKLDTVRLDAGGVPVVLEDVRLWGLRRGSMLLDVDDLVDKMLGSRIDDTLIVGFALFRHQGRWVGLALGYNRDGVGRSGAMDLASDELLFPNPPEFKAAGRYLRGHLERIMPSVTLFKGRR